MCSFPVPAPATLNGDVINKAQFEALQHAMKQLEGKFSAAMRSNADLTDQKENLEHIILQLQGETETIGTVAASCDLGWYCIN
jgi:predicted  nucleic acid-binding Zn-ribbon protein